MASSSSENLASWLGSDTTVPSCVSRKMARSGLPFNAISRSRNSPAFIVDTFLGFPLSLTTIGASSMSLTSVVKLSAPLGRPRDSRIGPASTGYVSVVCRSQTSLGIRIISAP